MTNRQLWKESPEFRRSIRKMALLALGGAAFGFTWGQIGKRLPGLWGVAWSFVFIGGSLAATAYMTWDMRRMQRQREEWGRQNARMLEELKRAEISLRALPTEEQRKMWLQ